MSNKFASYEQFSLSFDALNTCLDRYVCSNSHIQCVFLSWSLLEIVIYIYLCVCVLTQASLIIANRKLGRECNTMSFSMLVFLIVYVGLRSISFASVRKTTDSSDD